MDSLGGGAAAPPCSVGSQCGPTWRPGGIGAGALAAAAVSHQLAVSVGTPELPPSTCEAAGAALSPAGWGRGPDPSQLLGGAPPWGRLLCVPAPECQGVGARRDPRGIPFGGHQAGPGLWGGGCAAPECLGGKFKPPAVLTFPLCKSGDWRPLGFGVGGASFPGGLLGRRCGPGRAAARDTHSGVRSGNPVEFVVATPVSGLRVTAPAMCSRRRVLTPALSSPVFLVSAGGVDARRWSPTVPVRQGGCGGTGAQLPFCRESGAAGSRLGSGWLGAWRLADPPGAPIGRCFSRLLPEQRPRPPRRCLDEKRGTRNKETLNV